MASLYPLEPSSASSLLDHFSSHPHIANLVHQIIIQGPAFLGFADTDDDNEEAEKHYAQSLGLLSTLQALRRVRLDLRLCDRLEEAVIVCSKLSNLEYLLLTGSALRITPQVKTAFLGGYPVLKHLSIQPINLIETGDSTMTSEEEQGNSPKSSLRGVVLQAWFSDGPNAASILFDTLKSAFDWSQVTVCYLGGRNVLEETLLHLALQPNLVELRLSPVFRDIESFYTTVVAALPFMINIENLIVEEAEAGDVFESPFTIVDFLDLLPQNLKVLVLVQFAFEPDDSFKIRKASDLEAEGKESLRILDTFTTDQQRLILCEFDTGSGREWCRVDEEEVSFSFSLLLRDLQSALIGLLPSSVAAEVF
ncbi:uncharacterized protein JCM6883_002967 [Sporobolomyces salmoneus]|uniref:uncharacterized protein n=1 Tax=Sporobolomyces salmoneus TaxID=183962 RepID=UPI00317DE917